jgi:hypothetical protein
MLDRIMAKDKRRASAVIRVPVHMGSRAVAWLWRILNRATFPYIWALFLRRHAARFVANVHFGLLGRAPDASAEQRYLSALRTRSLSRADIVCEITNLPEFRNAYLRRVFGDATLFDEALQADIEQSPKILGSFLTEVYRGLLDREPDENAMGHYLPPLIRRDFTRAQLLREFIESREFRANQTDKSVLPLLAEIIQELQTLLISEAGLRGVAGGQLQLAGSRALQLSQTSVAIEAVRDLVLAFRDSVEQKAGQEADGPLPVSRRRDQSIGSADGEVNPASTADVRS